MDLCFESVVPFWERAQIEAGDEPRGAFFGPRNSADILQRHRAQDLLAGLDREFRSDMWLLAGLIDGKLIRGDVSNQLCGPRKLADRGLTKADRLQAQSFGTIIASRGFHVARQ